MLFFQAVAMMLAEQSRRPKTKLANKTVRMRGSRWNSCLHPRSFAQGSTRMQSNDE